MTMYRAEIERFRHDQFFKVIWATGEKPHEQRELSYLIDQGHVVEITGQIRDALDQLVGAAVEGHLQDGLHDQDIAEMLRTLKQHGYELRTALFHSVDAAERSRVELIGRHFAELAGHPSICFMVRDKTYVPWALMSDNPPSDNDNDIDVRADLAFWGIKYGVSTIYDPLEKSPAADIRCNSATFASLVGVHDGVYQKVMRALTPTDPEHALFMELDRRMPFQTSAARLHQAWKKREPELGLLYLFCHADGTRIAFSEDQNDQFSPVKFSQDYSKTVTTPPCLVFLNGCATAIGNPNVGFLDATSGEGFCGFIGAEADLPDLFAHRFAAAVISGLYGGMPLVELIRSLRVQHWPLGLFYGLYAAPYLQLDPPSHFVKVREGNYSHLPVGHRQSQVINV